MYEDIRKNKIKTGFIVGGFLVIITLIVYYICLAFDFGPFSIIFALIVSIISSFITYYNSDKIVLALNRARPATVEENRKLVNILDALVVAAGLESKPKLYIIDDMQPNAFATGRNPENAVICVTSGLLEKMDYYELEGVIAHELAHVKNYDILLSAVVSVMVGLVVMLSDMFTRTFFFSNKKDSDSKGNAILMLIGLVFLIISPIFAKLIQLAVSRRREYLADATAVGFTRNPDGLVNALKKLDQDEQQLKFANSSTAHMYIVNPFKSNAKRKTNWFSTHPSIENRITAINDLK